MKLTFKGIGWLIFGLLIIASSFEEYGWRDKLSTMGIGVTFALVYVMKQFFKPRWYALFIVGGVLLSFCIYNGINEELVMPLAIAAGCLGAFYVLNKKPVDEIMDGLDSLGNDEIENFDYVAPESYEDAVADGEVTVTENGESSDSTGDGSSYSPIEGLSDNAENDGIIEIEATVPAPKAKTKAGPKDKTKAGPKAKTKAAASKAKTKAAASKAKTKAAAPETKAVEFDLYTKE